MTAANDRTREALAAALLDADFTEIDKTRWREIVGDDAEASYDAYLDALLPVVERLAAERAVQELREAALEIRGYQDMPVSFLLDRADALDPS